MKQYLINHGSKLRKDREAFAPRVVYELSKDSIIITALKDLVDGEKRYFENPEAGWDHHLAQDDPFESMVSNTSMVDYEAPDTKEFEKAKKFILKQGGKEVTVTWEIPS